MDIKITGDDFFHLITSCMEWGESWKDQAHRFEHVQSKWDTPPGYQWKWAYWITNDYVHVIMCRAYLESIGMAMEVIWDQLGGSPDNPGEYVILTDYLSIAPHHLLNINSV